MLRWIKAAAVSNRHPLFIAAVCVLCLAATAVFPASVKLEASAMYLITNDTYVSVDHPDVDVFLTDANAELISHKDGKDLLLNAGLSISILYNGETITTVSSTESVRELLQRMRIYPSPLEMVALSFVDNTLTIEIASEFVFFEHLSTPIASDVIYQYIDDKPDWYEEVIQPGSEGVYTETYEIIFQDGVETGRQLIEVTEIAPVPTIVAKGTLENFANNDDVVTSIITNEDGSGVLVLENGRTVTFREARTMKGTAYNCNEPGLGTITYSGTTVHWGVVAVDKRVIPLGTKMYIVSNDGYLVYGFAIAEDTGVRGEHVDLYMDSWDDMINFGIRNCTVYILD